MTTLDYTPAGAALDGPTALDGLLADLSDLSAQVEQVAIDVPGRPGWEVVYGLDLPYERLAMLRRGAADPQMPSGVNDMALACALLATQCRGLLLNGEPVTHEGQPVTFQSASLQARLGAKNPTDAVRAFYPRFGAAKVATLLLAALDGGDADPTVRSVTSS